MKSLLLPKSFLIKIIISTSAVCLIVWMTFLNNANIQSSFDEIPENAAESEIKNLLGDPDETAQFPSLGHYIYQFGYDHRLPAISDTITVVVYHQSKIDFLSNEQPIFVLFFSKDSLGAKRLVYKDLKHIQKEKWLE